MKYIFLTREEFQELHQTGVVSIRLNDDKSEVMGAGDQVLVYPNDVPEFEPALKALNSFYHAELGNLVTSFFRLRIALKRQQVRAKVLYLHTYGHTLPVPKRQAMFHILHLQRIDQ